MTEADLITYIDQRILFLDGRLTASLTRHGESHEASTIRGQIMELEELHFKINDGHFLSPSV